jgi:hypothetical protein
LPTSKQLKLTALDERESAWPHSLLCNTSQNLWGKKLFRSKKRKHFENRVFLFNFLRKFLKIPKILQIFSLAITFFLSVVFFSTIPAQFWNCNKTIFLELLQPAWPTLPCNALHKSMTSITILRTFARPVRTSGAKEKE